MTIPDFQTVMQPILEFLADGQTRRTRDVTAAIADEFELSAEERAVLLPSGGARLIDNRVGWALTHMSQAGLLERPQRAHVRLSDAGRVVLAEHPDRVDMKVLNGFPAYVEFRQRSRERAASSVPGKPATEVHEQVSPQDLVAQAQAENRAAVEGELVTRALGLTSQDFERLVIELLKKMGYGRLGDVAHSGKSGDGGIDGIISQDPLGLDRIYVQAKRYAVDQTVSRPTIQGFVGALMGAQGDRGVFITTSSFTSGARTEAERVNARIELIDGSRLAGLMVDYGVGVQTESAITLVEIDEDFFEDL